MSSSNKILGDCGLHPHRRCIPDTERRSATLSHASVVSKNWHRISELLPAERGRGVTREAGDAAQLLKHFRPCGAGPAEDLTYIVRIVDEWEVEKHEN